MGYHSRHRRKHSGNLALQVQQIPFQMLLPPAAYDCAYCSFMHHGTHCLQTSSSQSHFILPAHNFENPYYLLLFVNGDLIKILNLWSKDWLLYLRTVCVPCLFSPSSFKNEETHPRVCLRVPSLLSVNLALPWYFPNYLRISSHLLSRDNTTTSD